MAADYPRSVTDAEMTARAMTDRAMTDRDLTAPNAHRFEPASAATLSRWSALFEAGETSRPVGDTGMREFYASHLGMVFEEVRSDYARLRLPWNIHNSQPAGVLHGGAIASMIDMVVVPAVGSAYGSDEILMSTIELHVQYLGPVTADAVAEGWVVRRGRSIVFTQVEVRDHLGQLAAMGTATYRVKAI